MHDPCTADHVLSANSSFADTGEYLTEIPSLTDISGNSGNGADDTDTDATDGSLDASARVLQHLGTVA